MTADQIAINRQPARDALADRRPNPDHARSVLRALEQLERQHRTYPAACPGGCLVSRVQPVPLSDSFWFAPFAPPDSGKSVKYNLHWCLDCGVIRVVALPENETAFGRVSSLHTEDYEASHPLRRPTDNGQ